MHSKRIETICERLSVKHATAVTNDEKVKLINYCTRLLGIALDKYDWCYCEAVSSDTHNDKWNEWSDKVEELKTCIKGINFISKDVNTCFQAISSHFEFIKDNLIAAQAAKDLFQTETIFTLQIEITNNSGDFKVVLDKVARLINDGMVNDSNTYDDSQYTFRIAEDH